MNRDPSTLRTDLDATLSDPAAEQRRIELPDLVKAEWSRSGEPDLVEALHRHPQLLRDRSLLLNLALDEYKDRRVSNSNFDLQRHCQRFHSFGSSIEKSIFRQLETQRYIDDHPELLELFGEPIWPEPDDDFGDFLVRDELGRGAIARVYLCRQCDVGDRSVVVKAFPFTSAEASVLGRLDHPNIIPILSIGSVEERSLHYICMPFCGRSTLVDVLELAFSESTPHSADVLLEAARRWTTREDRLAHNRHAPPQRHAWCGTYVGGVVALAVEIAAALDHAHQQGIVHGDIKPSNILLTPEGRPLLMDFNLSVDYINAIGLCGGTLPYMPPEHLQHLQSDERSREKATTFDPRADIYSFGALLYELLTGTPPVDVPRAYDDPATAAKTAIDQLARGIRPVRQFNPQVGSHVEGLVLRCLSYDPADRPASMAEVGRKLRGELSLVPTAVRKVRKAPRKYAALFALLLALCSTAGAYWATRPPRHEIEFERGQRAYAAGNFADAVEHYATAVSNAPNLLEPRFELARAHLASGNVNLANEGFQKLAQEFDHPQSMAYAGYCFNLADEPTAAIYWHERAVASNIHSLGAINNLGASYLVVRGTSSQTDSLHQAQALLSKAVELDARSLQPRVNLVRLECKKAIRDNEYSPIAAQPHVDVALSLAPHNPAVQAIAMQWRELVLRRSQPGDQIVATTLQNLALSLPAEGRSSSDRVATNRTYYLEP